jgi:predicted nucleotidyltransferase component of viral defense system
MKNAMQLKAIMKNMAKDKNIPAQAILQTYVIERFLERISCSPYKQNFILKGGFLIAAMVGIDTRSTMDLDATLRNIPINTERITKMFEEISLISIVDGFDFSIKKVEEIRESDAYVNLRISLEACYPPMVVPLKVDITTGDRITPIEVNYSYQLMFEERNIDLLAYNLETILAEKIETIISRGDQNTRPRDFYDVQIIYKLFCKNINMDTLRLALQATSNHRSTRNILSQYEYILKSIENSLAMNEYWLGYQAQFNYAREMKFEDICLTIKDILDILYDIK